MIGIVSALLAAGISLSLSSSALGRAAAICNTEVPDPIDGFIGPILYGNVTINAPLDKDGKDTYMGFKFFPEAYTSYFCAAHCVSTTNYHKKHPNPDGSYGTCRFFISYTLFENGVPQGLYCSMYTRNYNASYATNTGEMRGSSEISMRDGYGYILDDSYYRTCWTTTTVVRITTVVPPTTTIIVPLTTTVIGPITTVNITISNPTTTVNPSTTGNPSETITIDKPTTAICPTITRLTITLHPTTIRITTVMCTRVTVSTITHPARTTVRTTMTKPPITTTKRTTSTIRKPTVIASITRRAVIKTDRETRTITRLVASASRH